MATHTCLIGTILVGSARRCPRRMFQILIVQAAATYRTNQGTYVAFRASGSTLATFRITATSPPTINFPIWSVTQNGCGSPFVTSTDGTNNMIVWTVGTNGDQRLHGYDGDSGAIVYGGGGANELMAGTHKWSTTGIVARGRIYVATANKVYAFKVPGGTPTPTPTGTANCDCHRHRPYANCDCDCNSHSYAYCYSNGNSDRNAYGDPDCHPW